MTTPFEPCDSCPTSAACALHGPKRCAWTKRTLAEQARAAERERERPPMLPADPPHRGVQAQRESAGHAGAPTRPAPQQATPAPHWGPPMWEEFHGRPEKLKGDDEHPEKFKAAVAAELAWLAGFALRIPNGCTCRCRDGWNAIVARTAPDLTSAAAYAKWGFDRHNEVNAAAAVRKPALSWEAACEAWGWATL